MLTQVQIAAKRTERTMASRSKAKAKARRCGLHAERIARNRAETSQWLSDLGKAQQEATRQALESRRSKAAMPSHPPKGFVSRIKAFFRRTP